MRKTILSLVAALAVAFTVSSPASAGGKYRNQLQNPTIVAGAVVGTLVGIGLYEGWFGTANSFTAGTLARSATGAATGGLLAGIATVATIHALTTPCQGFHAVFGGSGCKNGKYVGPKRQAFLWW